MSADQSLYRPAPADAACAAPMAFNPANAFSPSDLMAFSIPEEETMWGFNPISPTMASWQGKVEQPVFCPPNLERGLKNSHVRNGQPTPPPFEDQKLQQGGMYPLAQYPCNYSPPEFSPRRRTGNLSSQTQDSLGAGSKRRKLDVSEREREKREKFLERNRQAASKCRQKKKEHTQNLENRYKEASARNSDLRAEEAHLRSEMLNLKDEILRHARCGNSRIEKHIQGMLENCTPPKGTQSYQMVDAQQSPQSSASQTLSFGFDSPVQFQPSDSEVTLNSNIRRDSEQTILTDSSYAFSDNFEDLINV
ncbi:hypothetical protein BBP40_004671 [Aspergillus hancockii]|nr:hypothetical protein BBP40_004671 [Aspergillus hancockii]